MTSTSLGGRGEAGIIFSNSILKTECDVPGILLQLLLEFYLLDLVCFGKVRFVKQVFQLLAGRDAVACCCALGRSEDVEQYLPVPVLDVVVLSVLAVNLLLDRVTVVVEDAGWSTIRSSGGC